MALFVESKNPDHEVVNLDKVDMIVKGKGDRILFYYNKKQDDSVAWKFDDEASLNDAWTWLQEEFFTAQPDGAE